MRDETAVFLCLFDLEGDSLYSVKWYKGRREFYRFTPKETPAMKIFPIYPLEVEQEKSNATQLTLRNVQLSLSGRYSCEVSADAPSFHTALVSGDLDVVETPKGRPVISGLRHRYREGEVLHVNCSSSWSKPAAKLIWFVNDKQPPASNLVTYRVLKEKGGEREMSYLGLKMVVKTHHFRAGRLKVRCLATIHDVYYQSTEKSVEEDKPRGIQSSEGAGNPYIPPPPIYVTDLPPPGHRFEHDTQQDGSTAQTSGVTMTTHTTPLLLVALLFTVR